MKKCSYEESLSLAEEVCAGYIAEKLGLPDHAFFLGVNPGNWGSDPAKPNKIKGSVGSGTKRAYVGNIAQPKFYAVRIGDFFNRVEHVKTCRILTRLTRFTGFILTT
jgi:hypothetical protein